MNETIVAGKSNTGRAALKFVLMIGGISFFADFTYEGARSVTGPFRAVLGAKGTIVGIVAGLEELLGYGMVRRQRSVGHPVRHLYPGRRDCQRRAANRRGACFHEGKKDGARPAGRKIGANPAGKERLPCLHIAAQNDSLVTERSEVYPIPASRGSRAGPYSFRAARGWQEHVGGASLSPCPLD